MLRAHLTEFKDHDLLKYKKGADGGQLMYVPLAVEDLKSLLETLQATDE
jgi:origin recognition complex subunit 2